MNDSTGRSIQLVATADAVAAAADAAAAAAGPYSAPAEAG